MRHTHKMATKTSGNALSFSFGECICSKGSSSIGYRVDWFKKHRNQFVGRPDEDEEEEKACITVVVYFSYFGSVVG